MYRSSIVSYWRDKVLLIPCPAGSSEISIPRFRTPFASFPLLFFIPLSTYLRLILCRVTFLSACSCLVLFYSILRDSSRLRDSASRFLGEAELHEDRGRNFVSSQIPPTPGYFHRVANFSWPMTRAAIGVIPGKKFSPILLKFPSWMEVTSKGDGNHSIRSVVKLRVDTRRCKIARPIAIAFAIVYFPKLSESWCRIVFALRAGIGSIVIRNWTYSWKWYPPVEIAKLNFSSRCVCNDTIDIISNTSNIVVERILRAKLHYF